VLGAFTRDDDTAEFLDAAARGQFLVKVCNHGHFSEPAAAACTTCASAELTWAPASGRAQLVSWAVTHTAAPGEEPSRQVLVIGELDEGPWWWSCIPNADPDSLRAGDPLLVDFERPDGTDEALPVFRLAR
jgi:uncharacterized OB-fold protein